MDAIVAENLSKVYPGKTALAGLNLAVRKNTVHGFLGPNGAGKTTTMSILSCLVKQTTGRACILGQETLDNPLWVKERLGFLPETPPLYGDMRVGDFLLFKARLYQMSKKTGARNVDRAMDKVGLGPVKGRLIDHLSKGYKQRVGIASALVPNPPVLILDEPAAGLDPASVREVRQLMLSLRESHTVMLSSHHLGEVGQVCDEITIIKEGKLVLSDSFARMQQRFFGKNPLELVVRGEEHHLQSALAGFGPYQATALEGNRRAVVLASVESYEQRAIICRRLVENQLEVFELKQGSADLEDIFIDVVGEG